MKSQYNVEEDHNIKGLYIANDFITQKQNNQLIGNILKQEWNTSLKRRTQHYGYQYSYDRKSKAQKTTQIPDWCVPIMKRIQQIVNTQCNKTEKSKVHFDQIIVNQYEPGQGINPHIDNINLFQEVVVSLSLNSDCIMMFQKQNQKIQVLLKKYSIIILTGDARYIWKHSIPSRKSDNGTPRSTRYSLTFRQMKSK